MREDQKSSGYASGNVCRYCVPPAVSRPGSWYNSSMSSYRRFLSATQSRAPVADEDRRCQALGHRRFGWPAPGEVWGVAVSQPEPFREMPVRLIDFPDAPPIDLEQLPAYCPHCKGHLFEKLQ